MQQWRLLSLVIANLRDSAFGRRLEETETELLLAQNLNGLLETEDVAEHQLLAAILSYEENGAIRGCLHTSHRAEIYRSILLSNFPIGPKPPLEAFRMERRLLRIGLRRLELFCSQRRLDLVYFEAHHLHNGPQRLVNDYAKGLRHYVAVERPFVIDRFNAANTDSEFLPATAYGGIWAEMDLFGETFSTG
jgi:hypothetical protein